MSFLRDIEYTLKDLEALAKNRDWSGIAEHLSWDSLQEFHARVVDGRVRDIAADHTALIIEYSAYAGLVYGMDTAAAITSLEQIIRSKAYEPTHMMMFNVHLAQYHWHFGNKTYAYGHIMAALDIARQLPERRLDLAIVELIRCVFGVRDMLGEDGMSYKIPRRELRSIAWRLRPSWRYGDSWELRRLAYLWLAMTHHTVGNKTRRSFYVARAGRRGEWIDWDAETKRPLPYAVPTFLHATKHM